MLYRHCADIYRLVTALPDALDAAHSAVQGIVTLHLSGHVHWPELPALIAAYRQEYPLVRFRIKRGTCGDILSLLAQKNAALGVVSAPDARPTSAVRRCSSRTCCTTPPPARRPANCAARP